jgi:hypothetical protein
VNIHLETDDDVPTLSATIYRQGFVLVPAGTNTVWLGQSGDLEEYRTDMDTAVPWHRVVSIT